MSTFHGGKLKSFEFELRKLRPSDLPKPQSHDDILFAMRVIRETMADKVEQDKTTGE